MAAFATGCGSSDDDGQSLGVTYVTSQPFNIPPFEQVGGFVNCPKGQVAIGGGGWGSSADTRQSMDASIPRKGPNSAVPNQWAAWFNNGTSTPNSFIVYAVCAPADAQVTGSFVQR
ncbi:MAG TPA: hypothetical protein VF259_01620 [Solirubrobacterales bacterium]